MEVVTTEDVSLAVTVSCRPRASWRKLPLRLSVRTLMLAVVLFGVVLGWFVHLAHVQRDAVAAIVFHGGSVTYNWQHKSGPSGRSQIDRTSRPNAPRWLLEWLGPDYFGHVEQVHLGPRNQDAVMEHVGRLGRLRRIHFFTGIDLSPLARAGLSTITKTGLPQVQSLVELSRVELADPEVSGAGFKYLKDLTELEVLTLPRNISVIDAELAYLSRLTGLCSLELCDPRITDAGIEALKDMTKLTFLRLANTQVSGAGLKNLRAMNRLSFLDLNETRVDHLSAIGQLTGLKNLNLAHAPIDDAGLAPVAGLTGLNALLLTGTRITGASCTYLTGLSNLKRLALDSTQLSDEGTAALASLAALNYLDMSATRITDVTLACLKELPALAFLNLRETDTTDAGLAALATCRSLRRVDVKKTRVTVAGVRAFWKVRPDVRIAHSGS